MGTHLGPDAKSHDFHDFWSSPARFKGKPLPRKVFLNIAWGGIYNYCCAFGPRQVILRSCSFLSPSSFFLLLYWLHASFLLFVLPFFVCSFIDCIFWLVFVMLLFVSLFVLLTCFLVWYFFDWFVCLLACCFVSLLSLCSIQLAFSSRYSLRGRSARVSCLRFSYFVNALRVSRAVTRLTVYCPHRVRDISKSFNSFSIRIIFLDTMYYFASDGESLRSLASLWLEFLMSQGRHVGTHLGQNPKSHDFHDFSRKP